MGVNDAAISRNGEMPTPRGGSEHEKVAGNRVGNGAAAEPRNRGVEPRLVIAAERIARRRGGTAGRFGGDQRRPDAVEPDAAMPPLRPKAGPEAAAHRRDDRVAPAVHD